jgi:serine/threonine protein kinase
VSQPGAKAEGARGRYTLFAEIASGGMATVHIGRLVGPGGFARTVAIKKLHPQYARDPDFLSMFLDEARMAARIRHPNVVPTLDVVAEGDELLIVMEFVPGETLSRLMKATRARGERIDPRIACSILANVLHGLHAAHEAQNEFGEPLGIVHRDVSPQNVLVGTDGVARLLDFGVAKAIGRFKETHEAQLKGKLPYMAPEQIQGGNVTRQSDVFAAAIVLWETLTMRRLFDADGQAQVMSKVFSLPIERPSQYATPDMPPELDAITMRGLERDPHKRFSTARDMALALEHAIVQALPSEVGEWVSTTAGDAIAMRAGRVREMESMSAGQREPGPALISTAAFIHDVLWSGQETETAPTAMVDEPIVRRSRPTPAPLPSRPSQVPLRVATKPPEPDADTSLSLMGPAPQPVVAVEASEPGWASRARGWGKAAAVMVLSGSLVLGGAQLLLPGYARQRAIATAAAEGLSLAIENVRVGAGGVKLLGVNLSTPDVPGASVSAAEVDVELAWLEPKLLTMRGVEVKLDGPLRDTTAAVETWYRAHHSGVVAPGAGTWLRVEVPTAHLIWSRAFGADGTIEATDVAGDMTPKVSARTGDEFHFTTKQVTLSNATTVSTATDDAGSPNRPTIGPWRVDLDREPNGSRVRLAFDPPVPDGPSALLVRGASGEISVDVTIPRVPLYRIGVPPGVAAVIPLAPAQLDANLHSVESAPDRVQASFSIALYGAHVPPMPAPVDVKVSGSIMGDPRAPLDLKEGQFRVGPLRGTLTGPVALTDDGATASLTWKAAPTPCSQFAPPSPGLAMQDLQRQLGALGNLGDLSSLGLDVGALTQAAGVAHITGNLVASGTVSLDSSDIRNAQVTAVAKNSCGLSLFRK